MNGQTNEAYWWKSVDHSNIAGDKDGNIELVSTPANALNQTTVSINNAGEDKTIDVTNTTGATPAVVPVDLVVKDPAASPTPAVYTDRWLIYNSESATAKPSPFFRVKFMGASGWAGKGDAGHVVGGQSNAKTNRRLEW